MKIKLYLRISFKKIKKKDKIIQVKKMRKTIAFYFFYNFFIQIFVTELTFEHFNVSITAGEIILNRI